MKRLILSIFILAAAMRSYADNVPVDSLQQQLTTATTDSLKASLYTKLANSYMNYGAIQDYYAKTSAQENALKYTLSALHHYSRMDDSTGLRICYGRLSKVYRDQKKFSQAKWFILQANTMARAQNDLPSITESLITLAGIKMDIKDYYLAKGDLAEALEISSANRLSNLQANLMVAYARYYNHVNKRVLADAALKRYSYMKDSMKRDSASHYVTKVRIIRKKFYIANEHIATKASAPKSVSL